MKIFIILSRVPFPLEKGDKLRAYHQIKALSKEHEIHLCCLSEATITEKQSRELQKICSELSIFKLNKWKRLIRLGFGVFSDQPFQVKYFYDRSIHKKISKIIEDFAPEQIYAQLIRTAEYVKKEFDIPKTIDYMDALSKGIQRRFDSSPFLKRILLQWEFKRLLKYENLVFDYFDRHTIISEADRKHIYHPKKEEILIVPNGVDFDFFKPIKKEKKYDLVFTGNMAYPPNINCAQYIAKAVFPLLKKQRPEIKIMIAGTSPSKEVLALANENITVSGWLDDIRDAYASAHIFLAPMQIGTGLQNKLLEAMAMKIPCISSPLANSALGAEDQKDILIGENAEQIANFCLLLLDNTQKCNEIANNGFNFVKSHFNWAQTGNQLSTLMKKKISV